MPLEYHEPYEELSPKTREIHRAVQSLIEELEAFDWYLARVDVSGDGELKSVLEHNMNEEVEHAAMVLEWLRRLVPKFDEELRTYLFTEAPIAEVEELAEAGEKGDKGGGSASSGSGLKIGSLR